MTTLGTKIRKLRELRNLKQEDMADKLGISLTSYGKLERDETDISMERLEQIAKVLGLSVPEVLSFDEKHVFNFLHNQNSNQLNYSGPNHFYFPEQVQKLYEDKIKLLEEKIKFLEKELERQKSGK
ncbi:MAG TPA: helix-turn-helix domain-containing protein [Cytophagaceae bacterium]